MLDQAIAAYPDHVAARTGRGVLLTRLGRRQAALKDAEESIRLDTAAENLYQVAGIYALTSRGLCRQLLCIVAELCPKKGVWNSPASINAGVLSA